MSPHPASREAAVSQSGSGPPLLLLHGFPQTRAMWRRVAPVLAQRYTVVCSDLRGYGDSVKPPAGPEAGSYAFRAMAAEQVSLMSELGYETFHVVGHDRGGRVAYRMALDHPGVIRSLSVLDIVPTEAVVDGGAAASRRYWHWPFLALGDGFPERLIAADPDYFFESFLTTFGGLDLDDLDHVAVTEYRRCWRDPDTIRGCCADYRAIDVDLRHAQEDAQQVVEVPTLALWGHDGALEETFDVAACWARRCRQLVTRSLPGGHYFVDQLPVETARVLADFLSEVEQA